MSSLNGSFSYVSSDSIWAGLRQRKNPIIFFSAPHSFSSSVVPGDWDEKIRFHPLSYQEMGMKKKSSFQKRRSGFAALRSPPRPKSHSGLIQFPLAPLPNNPSSSGRIIPPDYPPLTVLTSPPLPLAFSLTTYWLLLGSDSNGCNYGAFIGN